MTRALLSPCARLLLPGLIIGLAATAPAAPAAGQAPPEWVTLLSERGLLWALAAAFGTGVLVSFTPCVYPMIPITIGLIGGREETGGLRRSLFLSCVYVLGLAIVYSALGVVAGLFGPAVRTFLMSPYLLIAVAATFALLGLSMLGLFELQVPAALATRLQAVGGRGVLGLLLMGMVSGLVASPCVAAPLAGILTFVAVTGNAVTGFLLLFAFSWGMGLLLIVAGTSAGALKALPKSGEWMVGVKHLFGFVLLGAAAYFVRTLLPELVYYLVQAALLIAAGVALGALESLPPSPGAVLRAKRALAIVLVVLGCYVTVGTLHARGILLPRPLAPAAVAPAASPPAEIRWQSDIKQAFALAQRERRLVLLDFRADWCAACLEMEERVYPDPRVVQAVSRFVPLRVDMTDAGKEAEALGEKYQVAGLPAVVIARPTGELVTSVLGALETGDLLEFLRKVDAPTAGPSTGGPTSPQNRR